MILDVIRQVLWPSGFLAKLGRAVAALSVLALTNLAFDAGLGSVYQTLLRYYENLVGALVGWSQPWLEASLRYLGWTLHLHLHWKHIVVLLGIYFWRNASISYAAGDRAIGIFEFAWGLIVALSAGVLAGTIPLEPGNILENVLIGSIPVVGVFVYEIGDVTRRSTSAYRQRAARIHMRPVPTWWQFVSGGLRGSLRRTSFGILMLLAGCALLQVMQIPTPGLVMLAVLAIVQAITFLAMGVRDVRSIRKDGESWSSAYRRSGVAKVGAAMLSVFAYLGFYLITNAGLSFYGL